MENNNKKCEVCLSNSNELWDCEMCECKFCPECQADYNQFTLIDYNCCSKCADADKNRMQ